MSDWVDWQQNRRIKRLHNEVSAAYSYAGSRTRTLQAKRPRFRAPWRPG
jgi:hypothetical protein